MFPCRVGTLFFLSIVIPLTQNLGHGSVLERKKYLDSQSRCADLEAPTLSPDTGGFFRPERY